jgi:hypothetical protein
LDPEFDEAKDRALTMAYAYLGVHVTLPADWRFPQEYSLLEAQKALLDDIRDLATSHAKFPITSDLPEDHYDGLTFSAIRPHYSEHRYNADGMRTTKLQRKQLEKGESSDLADNSGSIDSESPVSLPVAKIMEIMEDIQPTGVSAFAPSDTSLNVPEASTSHPRPVLQLNTSAEPTLLAATSTPASISNSASTIHSAQASAISSASSAHIPLPSMLDDAATRGRSQRKQQQVADYQASSTAERSRADKNAWDVYFREQET